MLAKPCDYVWNFDYTNSREIVDEAAGIDIQLNPTDITPYVGDWGIGAYDDFGLPRPAFGDGDYLSSEYFASPKALHATGVKRKYSVAVFDKYLFDDFEATTYFRIQNDEGAQAVGIVFGFQDADDYYIARAGSEDDKVTLYRMFRGKKYEMPRAPERYDENYSFAEKWTAIAKFETEQQQYKSGNGDVTPGAWTAEADVKAHAWQELCVKRVDGVIDVWLNGAHVLRYLDLALRYGQVGFFVKHDTEALFAGLQVEGL
jgi:hypothetical protein